MQMVAHCAQVGMMGMRGRRIRRRHAEAARHVPGTVDPAILGLRAPGVLGTHRV